MEGYPSASPGIRRKERSSPHARCIRRATGGSGVLDVQTPSGFPAPNPFRSVLSVPFRCPFRCVSTAPLRHHIAQVLDLSEDAAVDRRFDRHVPGVGGLQTVRPSSDLARARTWLTVERLPGYAPELNPVEQIWGNIKGRELANLCPADILALRGPLRAGFARIRGRSTLAFGFLRHAGLSF